MASEAPDIIVKFDHVQKSYDGENLVVKDLNLDVERGEFLTMLGPSGSGKTTVLMMLAGFETATHGEIFLNSVPINNVAPHKRGIGMVFQNYALFPHMTVAENLAFPLQSAPRPALGRPTAACGGVARPGLRARPRTHGRASGRTGQESARRDAV